MKHFQQILPTLDFFYLLDCLVIVGLDRPVTLILFLVSHLNFLFIPCGRLSCYPSAFCCTLNTLSYRIVPLDFKDFMHYCGVARWLSGRASDLRSESRVWAPAATLLRNNLRQVVYTLLPLSPSSIIWYQRKLGSKQAYHVVHQPVSRGLAVFADAWLSGWLAEISADLRETVAH